MTKADAGGFNEAEAIKPRNREMKERHHLTERLDPVASMRPRQSSLGIPHSFRA